MPTPKKRSAPTSKGFSAEEREAMRDLARERKAEALGLIGEKEVLARIATLAEPDRSMARRIHALIRTTAPALAPKLWYGMPAYARAGKVLCFFQSGQKFKSRYCTLGFTDTAEFDDGPMWPTGFALAKLDAATERRIVALIESAVK